MGAQGLWLTHPVFSSATCMLKKPWKSISAKLWPNFPPHRKGIMAWAKLSHRGVLWLQCLQVLWSLSYWKDNVLLLHPKLKVRVVEIAPCLTAWIRFTGELLVNHFLTQEKQAASSVLQTRISQITPEIPPTCSGEVLSDLWRGSEAGSFLLNSDCQDCVCSRTQWARDGSLAWRSRSMAWLSHGAELTLLPSQRAKTPWPCCLVETTDLCYLSDHAEANLREEKLARAKPTFVSRLTMVWAALTRLVLCSLSFISADRAHAGCLAFPENSSQGMWGNL